VSHARIRASNQSASWFHSATTSPATGGVLNQVDLPTAVKKLGDEFPTPFEGQKISRVYGGDAQATGASWSPSHPGSVADHRDVAGLPSGKTEPDHSVNSGQFLLEATLRDPLPNGIEKRAIQLDRVSGINPEF